MLEIPLFVLVIQIGFNAALNNRGYSSNPLIPIASFGNSGQTRRLADSDRYLLSRSSSASNEMPEPEYDSFEDYSFRSYQPVQYPYQRWDDDLRYGTRPENDESLETAPIGRINSNNYAESVQPSSSASRRPYPKYSRPYSARGHTNLRQGQIRKYYDRKRNDDSSVEVSFLEDPEDTSREEAESLLSLFKNSNNRRGQNRKYYRKGNSLSADASPIDKLDADEDAVHSPDDENTGKLTFLRLSNLEDLNLESPLLRNQDQNGLNNRKSNSRNFLKFSLSPYNKVTLDEGIVSDLSELLSETLNELNLVPVSLRRTGPSSNKYNRRENRLSAEENDLTNPSDLRLGSLDISNSELPIRRCSEPTHCRSKNNLRHHGNNRAVFKKQFDEGTAKTLLPYHEGNRKILPNSRRNENQNSNRRDDFSDEFSLDTLFDFRKEGHDDKLDLDDNLSSDLSVLRSTNQDNLSLKSSLLRSSDKNVSKPTTDILNLEYPWTDVLSPSKNKTTGLRSVTQLSNSEQDKTSDSSDPLHLKFPWNGVLSPGRNKSGKSKSNFKSPKQKDDKKDTTDVLHLEYPWNDQLTPDNNQSEQLRSHDQEDKVKDTTDVLHLEFPWNDDLSPDGNKTGKSKSLGHQTDSRQDKEPKDKLKLKFPWNDKTNQDKPSSKKTAIRIPDPFYVHPYLRNRNIMKHPNYFGRSYDDFNGGVRLENHKNSPPQRSNSPSRRSNRRLIDSENLRVLPIAKQESKNQKNFFEDSVSVESPS